MSKGARATLHSAARLPRRHPFAIAGGAMALALILLGAGLLDTRDQINIQRNKITKVIQSASVCNEESLKRKKRSAECAERLRIALVNCRFHPTCQRAWTEVALKPPSEHQKQANPPSTGEGIVAQGGDSQPPGHEPGQQPGGGSPPNKTPGKNPPKKAPQPQPGPSAPVPAPSPAPEPEPEPSKPGNGNGGESSQGKGLGVELCVSNPLLPACVNAGLSAGE